MVVRRVWTLDPIEAELAPLVVQFGRLPSCNELTRLGRNALGCAACKHGGMVYWAKRMGTVLKDSATARGVAVEDAVEHWLRAHDLADIERQRRRGPFDIRVGTLRVNVKSGRHAKYQIGAGKHGCCSGYFFGIGYTWKHCDFFIICPVDSSNTVLRRYVVPASRLQIQTLTLTPKKEIALGAYIEAVDLLRPPGGVGYG